MMQSSSDAPVAMGPSKLSEAHIRGGVRVIGEEGNRKCDGKLEPHLRVAAVVRTHPEDDGTQALVLIDSGAEVCLISKGLLPRNLFREATKPLRLVAANQQVLAGGSREVELAICFKASDVDTHGRHVLRAPTALYEADIEEDVILSYEWLGERDILMAARQHGLWVNVGKQKFWVAGVRSDPQQRRNAKLP